MCFVKHSNIFGISKGKESLCVWMLEHKSSRMRLHIVPHQTKSLCLDCVSPDSLEYSSIFKVKQHSKVKQMLLGKITMDLT